MTTKELDEDFLLEAVLWLRWCKMHNDLCDLTNCEMKAQRHDFLDTLPSYKDDPAFIAEIKELFYK